MVKKSGAEAGEAGEEKETPIQRFERLRAEVSGFLRDIENIRSSRAQGEEAAVDELDGVNMVELADRLKVWQVQLQAASKKDGGLDVVSEQGRSGRNVAQSELTNQLLGKIAAMKGEIQDSPATASPSSSLSYHLVYSQDSSREMKIAHISDLERRLSVLEQVVTGSVAPEPSTFLSTPSSTSTSTSTPNSSASTLGLISSLEDVRIKVSSLDEHAIDQLSHRMLKLTKQYESLKAVREAAYSNGNRQTTDLESPSPEPGSSTPSSHPSSPPTPSPANSLTNGQGNAAQIDVSKIDTLFHSMTSIQTVASELPIVVDRLVQLRALHEQAVQFSSQISAISSSQSDISSVLTANLAGIQRMQDSLTSNMATIEKNVLALEKRIADVSTLLSK